MIERHGSPEARATRRGVLAATVAVGLGAVPAGAQEEPGEGGDGGGTGDGTSSESIDYGGWFDDVATFEGTVDRRGQDSVTVEVGTQGNGGPYAFDPTAVHVDPGTTVTWEWTGDGMHDVAAEDDAYASELVQEADHTFEYTFEETGISRYACTPHKPMGMKGAVAVGDVATAQAAQGDTLGDAIAIGGGLGLVAGLFGLFGLARREGGRPARTE